jgi:hypothetical protein
MKNSVKHCGGGGSNKSTGGRTITTQPTGTGIFR